MANTIHPTAIVEEGVQLGTGNIIGAYSILKKGTMLGNNNVIEPYALIGATPSSDLDANLPSGVIIGNNNVIGANTIIQRSMNLNGNTSIGSNNNIYNNVTIGHDCTIGNFNLMNAYVGLTGFISIGDYVTLCPYVGVGKASISNVVSTFIDDYSFISSYCRITNSVPMLSLVIGGYNPYINNINTSKLQEVLLDYKESEQNIKDIMNYVTKTTSSNDIIQYLDTHYPTSLFAKRLRSFFNTYRNTIKRKHESNTITTS